MAMMLVLTNQQNGEAREIALDGQALSIGKSPDNDIALDFAAISRRQVALTAGEFTRRTSYAAGPARS